MCSTEKGIQHVNCQLWGILCGELERSWYYKTPGCLQSKEFDLSFTVNREVIVLMKANLKNSWTVFCTIFTISTLPKHCQKWTKSITITFMEKVQLWSRELGLFVWKLGRYYKLSKDCSYLNKTCMLGVAYHSTICEIWKNHFSNKK